MTVGCRTEWGGTDATVGGAVRAAAPQLGQARRLLRPGNGLLRLPLLRRQALREMDRVLRPSGLLLLADNVEASRWDAHAVQLLIELVTVPLGGEHSAAAPSPTYRPWVSPSRHTNASSPASSNGSPPANRRTHPASTPHRRSVPGPRFGSAGPSLGRSPDLPVGASRAAGGFLQRVQQRTDRRGGAWMGGQNGDDPSRSDAGDGDQRDIGPVDLAAHAGGGQADAEPDGDQPSGRGQRRMVKGDGQIAFGPLQQDEHLVRSGLDQ